MVDAVLEDFRTAPVSEREKALFAYIERVNRESYTLQKEDVQAVVASGWSEEAVYDAISVCALFNFYNKWVDATGVGDMPAAASAASGQRMAIFGYIPSSPAAVQQR
ncbi:MAG: carboxymuconolactone decarboxylase family protein [Gemmatimonadaceae bacterium]